MGDEKELVGTQRNSGNSGTETMLLVVFSGLPGTGESTLAGAAAHTLHIPVFAKDWLEATLMRCGLTGLPNGKPLGYAGYELLTTLAERQLQLGQSVILDSVASTVSIRQQWRELAERYEATWRVVECVCSDEALHRARLATRQRGIPGWHELTWAEVERVRTYYAPWGEERLVLDMTRPLSNNISIVLDYLK